MTSSLQSLSVMSLRRLVLAAVAASGSLSAVSAGRVQKPDLVLPSDAPTHQQEVVDIFSKSYEAYKQYAFGHDDLTPLNNSFYDGRNGWGASMADALDTMFLMGRNDWFEEAVAHFANIDFSRSVTNDTTSVFETTIRYVGGFLSAYELSGKTQHVLVEKAQQIADQLVYAYVGDNAIPFGHLNFTDHQSVKDTSNVAEAGTLTLEWNRLSQYTGNDTYRQLAEKSVKYMMGLPTPVNGIPPQGIDPATGKSVGSYITWGGGTDSYIEYLIKYPRLTNTDDQSYADTWLTAVDTSIQTLLRNSTVGNHLYLAEQDKGKLSHVGSHLACFHGGNWILGGKLLNNDTIVNYGLQLTDACLNTYASTATGIGPEVFAFISDDGDYVEGSSGVNSTQKAFYDQHGFYITDPTYDLRPEVLESNFYAYRVTGDEKYLKVAAAAIESIKNYINTTNAYAPITDVMDTNSPRINDMESFWFAEVLKYLFLTFDAPEKVSLDDFVFNTECHPFIAPAALPKYGSGNLMAPSNQPVTTNDGSIPVPSPKPF
ncbi:glycoside hydrolase family 47 protein [Coniophora puteana RWD-64-598 SS2]|uniref:alpha-1,2-Mannosidase n=1 Tax=Coniophora puteana (strain RWD-64-598) TaxID=741705 RepID=A0A5M3MGL9_CONPW|nr:glycoside hydrolase family 47 protein [Coniophora puteana RWD-64-598 SS2]EIW78379.1 glycoside hydrolase family 47 protein [Coniophora puteana RWD-64-598 SS2]